MQLTKEVKRTDLNMIVQVHITAVIGLLNIFTNLNLNYFWRRASEFVAKTRQCGGTHRMYWERGQTCAGAQVAIYKYIY